MSKKEPLNIANRAGNAGDQFKDAMLRGGVIRLFEVLNRYSHSQCPKEVRRAVGETMRLALETEPVICAPGRFGQAGWFERPSAREVFDRLGQASKNLEELGLGGAEIDKEAMRYLPIFYLNGSADFYNPATGRHDLRVDRGWCREGLPPRRIIR